MPWFRFHSRYARPTVAASAPRGATVQEPYCIKDGQLGAPGVRSTCSRSDRRRHWNSSIRSSPALLEQAYERALESAVVPDVGPGHGVDRPALPLGLATVAHNVLGGLMAGDRQCPAGP